MKASGYTRRIVTTIIQPASVEELAQALADAVSRKQTINLGGAFSKQSVGGPVLASDITISTGKLNRVLQYEPRDLTLSVEAGIPYSEVCRVLAEHRQMIPLDPPYAEQSTIGGVLASNLSEPRRRLYGTARDMVIGMTFATLQGKLIQTGGMVVKNVAGLDMAKMMIGSFGTLAAIATVNFKLYPMQSHTRTFVYRFDKVRDAIAARDKVLTSVLQPAAIDLKKDAGGYHLLIQAGGSQRVLDRYSQELAGAEIREGREEEALWRDIREAPRDFLQEHPAGAVTKIRCRLTEVGDWLERLPPLAIARAGSGVVYGFFAKAEDAAGVGVIEFAPAAFRQSNTLWPEPGDDFAMMGKVKRMLDPELLLNRGRLYGRL
jgi:glycolate oxidase FAD binding subunit